MKTVLGPNQRGRKMKTHGKRETESQPVAEFPPESPSNAMNDLPRFVDRILVSLIGWRQIRRVDSLYEEVIDYGHMLIPRSTARFGGASIMLVVPFVAIIFLLNGVNLTSVCLAAFSLVYSVFSINRGRFRVAIFRKEIRVEYGFYYPHYVKRIGTDGLHAHRVVQLDNLAPFLSLLGPRCCWFTRIDGCWVRCFSPRSGIIGKGVLLDFGDRKCLIESNRPDDLDAAISTAQLRDTR